MLCKKICTLRSDVFGVEHVTSIGAYKNHASAGPLSSETSPTPDSRRGSGEKEDAEGELRPRTTEDQARMAQRSEGLSHRDLSEALKESTKEVHAQAENTQFMMSFQKGQVSLREFKLYLASLYYIYSALEEESERNKDNPVYAPVYFPNELNRKAALEEDLEYFYGPAWKKEIQCHEATQKYVDRLHHVGQYEPELLVAHAYTRYLGDLSGGQILKKIAQKSLQLPSTGEGLSFFNFPGVTNISKFKQLYRARMNCLPMDTATEERILDEAKRSFLLNIEVFEELQRLTSQGRLSENNRLVQPKLELYARGTNRTHGPKENDRARMTHEDMLPSTPLLRWTLALFFLATTVAVGLYAM